jgi:methylase of polypeptide subunit release factors
MTHASSTTRTQQKTRGSARSNSLKSELLALRKAIAGRSETLDELLFACVEQQLQGTGYGVTASGLFEQIARDIPKKCAIEFPKSCNESTLGYIYQLQQLSRREQLQSRVQQPNKQTTVEDLIAFTQLYTPDWVVNFLVGRALPSGKTKLLDPACGSGHFLLGAMEHDRIEEIHGWDIDETGLFVAKLSLALKAARHPNRAIKLEHRDSLERSNSEERFDLVVGNPPYIGRKLMDRELKERLKKEYPTAHSDLCAAFIARGLELLKPGGKLAFITQSSLLVLPTYEELRKSVLREHRLDTVVELGPHVFPLVAGEKVNSVLLIIEHGQNTDAPCTYLDLRDAADKQGMLEHANWTSVDQTRFENFRGTSFNFSCPPSYQILRERTAPLSEHADIRQGLATTDNATFVRYWWQVPTEEIGNQWIPYAKGSGSERWFAPIDTVVDWRNNGEAIKKKVAERYPYLNGKIEWVVKNEQYYFREGLTFSFVNAKNLAIRWLPPGCIFDVGGSALFSDEQWFLLAYLNSSFIATFARHLNPTINFQVGDLKQLPYVQFQNKDELAQLAKECVELKQQYCRLTRETSWRQAPNELINCQPEEVRQSIERLADRLLKNEVAIDRIVNTTVSVDVQLTRERLLIPNDLQVAYLVTTAHLLNQKPFSLQTEKWIANTIGTSLSKYLDGSFMTKHTRAFRGTPVLTAH